MIEELSRTIRQVEELENKGFTRDQAIQIIIADAAVHAASCLDGMNERFYNVTSPLETGYLHVELDDGIEDKLAGIDNTLDDIGRAIDRTNDSVNSIEEDIRTGKTFVKGEISTYNLN